MRTQTIDDVVIRPARYGPADAAVYAELQELADGGSSRRTLGPDSARILAALFLSGETIHSYTRTFFASLHGEPVAHITCIASEDFTMRKAATLRATWRLRRFPALRMLFSDAARTVAGVKLGPTNDGHLHVASLGVREPFRRRGIATALITHAVRQGLEGRYSHLSLDVDASNGGAVAAYQRNGFNIASKRGRLLKMTRPLLETDSAGPAT